MKTIILAGGFGTRLRPLTVNIPKPMAPVMNTPMLEHIINLLKKNNLTDITMMLFFQPEIIMNYFKDGKNWDVKIDYIIAEKDLGTAGCITLAKEKIGNEKILIISGDVLTNFNLIDVINFHNEKNSLATIVLTKVTDPLRYGIVITEKDGKIKKFLEKPSWGEVFSDTINTGVYVLNPEILNHIPENANMDFSKNLFPLLLEKKEALYGVICDGYWIDIGTLAEYKYVHEQILDGDIECDIKGERRGRIGSDVWIGKNVKIDPKAKLKDSIVIGNNCVIEENTEISNAVIGDNNIIGKNSKIIRSVIWNNNKIGNETDIKEVVIGNNNIIKDKAYIGVGAVISDNCTIGKESIIKPEVKLWPGKKVEDNSIVSSSLIWGERWSNRLFDAYGITAMINTELTPEIGAKIGAAYASTLPKGSYILISRDYHRSSLMIERSIMSGILSAGVNIYDFRITPLPVSKMVAKSLNIAGGLHIRKSPYDEKMIDIKFFDNQGLDISLSQEKTIESSFFREEYRRVEDDKVGIISYPPRALEYYIESLKMAFDKEIIKKKKFKVVIDYTHGTTLNIFPSILGELDCEVVALNAYNDENKLTRSQIKFEEDMDTLADTVKILKADLGIMIDSGGQKIFLVDDKGRKLSGDDGLLVMIQLFLNARKSGKVAVPVTVTRCVEDVVNKNGGTLLRVGTTYRAMMTVANEKKADFVAEEKGGYIFSEFLPAFDGMMATIKVLEYLAIYGQPLSNLVDEIPEYNKLFENVFVPWDKRGAIMKELVNLMKEDTKSIEGIELTENDNRVLIIPDNDKPYFHIYAEAKTKPSTKSLVEKYKKYLKKIIEKI